MGRQGSGEEMRCRKNNKGTFIYNENLDEGGACISSLAFCLIGFSNNWKNGGINLRGGVQEAVSGLNVIQNNHKYL